jgi:hypothetical protein
MWWYKSLWTLIGRLEIVIFINFLTLQFRYSFCFFSFKKMSSHFEVNIFQKADTRSRQIVGHLIILNTQEQKNKKMAAQKKLLRQKMSKWQKCFLFPTINLKGFLRKSFSFGVNITNILQAAFTHADSKSSKWQWWVNCLFSFCDLRT